MHATVTKLTMSKRVTYISNDNPKFMSCKQFYRLQCNENTVYEEHLMMYIQPTTKVT